MLRRFGLGPHRSAPTPWRAQGGLCVPPFPLLQKSPNVSVLGAPEDRCSSRELPQARQPHKCPARLGSLALGPHFTGRRAAAHHGAGTDCAKGPCGPPTVQALPLLALPSRVPEASFYPPWGPHSTSQTSESWKRGLSHISGPHSANRGQGSRHFEGIWALQHYCITNRQHLAVPTATMSCPACQPQSICQYLNFKSHRNLTKPVVLEGLAP